MMGQRLGQMQGRIQSAPISGARVKGQAPPAWRRWYQTSRWQRLRREVLTEALFQCAMCGRVEAESAKLVVDHIVPHRGDAALFWDRANLQCLCAPCHAGPKQAQEAGGAAFW